MLEGSTEDQMGDEIQTTGIPQFTGQFARQIAQEEFERQKGAFTKSAVSNLQNSREYKQWHQRCSSCSSSWYDGEFSNHCNECGGFAMTRTCAVCTGHCGAVWSRDLDMSHKMQASHWNGKCFLPENEQRHFIIQKFVDEDEDALIEALSDLGKT